MEYTKLATDQELATTIETLKARNIEAVVVSTKAEALQKIKELVPQGASVMNGASTTLEEIGFVDYLKAGQHGWQNLHETIVNEKDPHKQQALRRQALLADYYLGSVHALAQTGEMLVASNSGSQLPHIVYSSPHVLFVVGAQKITPTFSQAYERLTEHVIPLEDARMKRAYGPESGTKLNKLVTFYGEPTYTGRKINMILVKEKLGF